MFVPCSEPAQDTPARSFAVLRRNAHHSDFESDITLHPTQIFADTTTHPLGTCSAVHDVLSSNRHDIPHLCVCVLPRLSPRLRLRARQPRPATLHQFRPAGGIHTALCRRTRKSIRDSQEWLRVRVVASDSDRRLTAAGASQWHRARPFEELRSNRASTSDRQLQRPGKHLSPDHRHGDPLLPVLSTAVPTNLRVCAAAFAVRDSQSPTVPAWSALAVSP